MMILSSNVIFAADTADSNIDIEDLIIQQAILADSVTDWSDYEFTVVEVEGEGSLARGVDSGESSSEKVLQTETTEDGVTTLTTLMPYKVDEDGKMINSFEYAESRGISEVVREYTDNFADVVVVTRVTFYTPGSGYARHGGVSAYWSCPAGTVSSIDRLFVSYRTYGMLYSWNSSGLGELLEDEAQDIKSVIERTNPVMGQVYGNYDQRMTSDTMLQFGSDSLAHAVSIEVNDEVQHTYVIANY